LNPLEPPDPPDRAEVMPPGKPSVPERTKLRNAEGLPVSRADLAWEEQAEQAYLDALPAVRSAAEKWAGLTGVILGVFGFASFTNGRDEIQSLTANWEPLTGGAALLALLIALGAVIFAGLAAQGTPKQVLESGEDLRLRSVRDARTARSRLRISRVGTAIAVILLLVALGMLWYAPTDSEENRPTFEIKVGPGDTVCGQLKALTEKEIVLDVGEGADVKLSQPRPVERVDRCD